MYCDNRNLAAMPAINQSAARGIMIEVTGRARVTRDITSGLASDMTTWGITCP
jgi:hypothetical protein